MQVPFAWILLLVLSPTMASVNESVQAGQSQSIAIQNKLQPSDNSNPAPVGQSQSIAIQSKESSDNSTGLAIGIIFLFSVSILAIIILVLMYAIGDAIDKYRSDSPNAGQKAVDGVLSTLSTLWWFEIPAFVACVFAGLSINDKSKTNKFITLGMAVAAFVFWMIAVCFMTEFPEFKVRIWASSAVWIPEAIALILSIVLATK